MELVGCFAVVVVKPVHVEQVRGVHCEEPHHAEGKPDKHLHFDVKGCCQGLDGLVCGRVVSDCWNSRSLAIKEGLATYI